MGIDRGLASAQHAGFTLAELSAALAVLLAGPAQAGTIEVTSNADPGGAATCTLRQALLAMANHGLGSATGNCANSGGPFGAADKVNFAFSGPTEIDLASLALHVNATVVVQATPTAPVTINAAPNARVLYIAHDFGTDWVNRGYPTAKGE